MVKRHWRLKIETHSLLGGVTALKRGEMASEAFGGSTTFEFNSVLQVDGVDAI